MAPTCVLEWHLPVPSRLIVTLTLVSLVCRWTVATRAADAGKRQLPRTAEAERMQQSQHCRPPCNCLTLLRSCRQLSSVGPLQSDP